MDVAEDLRGLRHILGATIACVKFAVAVLGAGEGPHRHGARAGSSNLGFDVRKAHSALLDKVRIRAVMGNDDFSLASRQDKHETHEICLSAAVSINNKGDELHALLDVIGVGVLSLLGVVGIPDYVGLGLSFAIVGVHNREVENVDLVPIRQVGKGVPLFV